MNGLTNYITQRSWAETITAWYVLVDDAYRRWVARRVSPCGRAAPPRVFRTVK